ncbi:hypothetical protein SAMN05216215_106156 [Saccharopolyspora shandongensis]|uniref:AAA domain-containing protein n=1 Tax=Saccharopolyspora shandongensis TaxID=418495 RepID=A0A1H3S977_9PSEU|nr:hypothetical protein [Saccharopolyspora shandongensis]SDZ34297.1 hypothetical protein SAMN05216215_106156 [Saccharopolyspora shandongensis]
MAFSELDAEYKRLTRAVDDYQEHARQLASTVAPELAPSAPSVIIDQLDRRLATARENQQTARLLHQQRDDVMQQRGLADAASHTASEQLAELLQRHAMADEASLDASIDRSRRRDELQQQRSDLEDTLADSGIELTTLEQLADEHDAATLTTLLVQLEDKVDALRRDKDTALERLGEIRAGLQRHNGSAAAAHAQQAAQQQLATIGDLTEEYLRLHIAEYLLRNEIENYRARRQDSVLAHAETLFSRLTNGEYPQLEAALDDTDTPILLAHSTEDQTRRVDQLNEGARDQLYLALRLATLQENSRAGQALPLILDDIFTSFDDQRTPVGLATLAELAEPIQIIVLTHHAAVANAARELPGATVSVHNLARAV